MKKILLIAFFACTPQDAKTAVDIAVKITDEVCTEEASDPNEPDWVKIACKVENGVAHILLPRTEWRAIRARGR